MTEILQNFVFADQFNSDKTALYMRWPDEPGQLADNNGILHIRAQQRLDLCTFYNALSLSKWRTIAGLTRVGLRLEGTGRVTIRVIAHNKTLAARTVHQETLNLDAQQLIWLDAQDMNWAKNLSIIVTALEETTLSACAWITDQAPRREVRIAAVITTFQREREARQAIKKFQDDILPVPSGGVDALIVIDNGQSLDPQQTDTVRVIPNSNLGGAGGFTRGLLHAMDQDQFTHVLFMDDDASCEPESVFRTAALLRHAKSSKTAVSGAMNFRDKPTLQYEKSAAMPLGRKFKSRFEAIGYHMDLADPLCVVDNDGEDRGNYGGWWFFCFPIEHVERLPFPFFVRGDDTDFSLSNPFDIVTLNGIASECDDLGKKLSPAVHYLTERSWFALCLMHSHKDGLRRHLRKAVRQALECGRYFDYGRMEASIAALEDVAKGPAFFADMPSPIERLKELGASKSGRPIANEEFDLLEPTKRKLKRWPKLLRKITQDGHKGRNRSYSSRVFHVRAGWEVSKIDTTVAQKIAVGEGCETMMFERDNARYLRNRQRLMELHKKLQRELPALADLYRSEGPNFRTRSYWDPLLIRD